MTQAENTMNEQIRLCDAEATSDHSRLVTYLNEQNQEYRAFLKTLEGIEFGMVNFDGNEEFGVTFLNNERNHDKIQEAGYTLMLTYPVVTFGLK
jgi:hypothetical protein